MPRIYALLIALLAGAGLSAVPAGAPSAAAATSAASPAKPTPAPPAKAGPAQPAREQPAAPSASEQRKLAAAAVRQALAQSAVPGTCSGPISPDTVYPCSTPSSSGTDTFTITLADTTDVLYVLPVSAGGNELGFTLTAPDASTVSCRTDLWQAVCPTSQAGTYTLAVGNGGSAYTLDYTALMSDTGCAAINPSFAAPAIAGSLAAGQTGSCYTLDVPSGSVLYLMGFFSTSGYPTGLDFYDSTGANQNCELIGSNTCTVGGTGPYRVFAYSIGIPDTYQLQLNTLTNPQGCVATPQLAYGQAPDTSSTDPCRTLTVTTAGSYQVVPVAAPTYGLVNGTVYAADGSVACQFYQYPYCPLAAGSYAFVAAPGQTGVPFGFDFIAGDQSSGCSATGDTGLQDGAATGTFAGIGEEICLTLPTPNGKADYFFEQQNPDGSAEPNVQVIDATGAPQCASPADFNYDTCSLSGTAPFRVLLSSVSAQDSYRILIQRTDTADCPVWPQSGFGGSYGATATLTASNTVKCLTIPAGQHSTGEMIDYSNAANVVDGAVYVNDPSGNQVCVGASLSLCSYQPHVTYTALVITTSRSGDTYHLVRRDVSDTAKCAAPASTTVGGPSTAVTLTSDLDTTCYQVTAAAADKLWFSVRASAPAPAGAVLLVTNASGAIACRQFGGACQVTGSTDYQALVVAKGYSGAAITAHLDTWLVGTAAGWAPQCQQNQFSAASGWGQLSGTLTENAAGYCAVVNLEPQQSFGIYGTDTAASPYTVAVNIYTAAGWASPFGEGGLGGLCGQGNYNTFGFSCSSGTATQAVLLVTPGTSQTPVGYTMQGVCQVTCTSPPQTATITSVTPSSQPAGPGNVIVVTGTGLNLGTQFQLTSNGSPANYNQIAFPQSVNAAGTQLTLALNTTGITPGTYDAVLNGVGYSVGTPSPGYLPGAYTVTAAS